MAGDHTQGSHSGHPGLNEGVDMLMTLGVHGDHPGLFICDHLDNYLWPSIFFYMTRYHLNIILPPPDIIKMHVSSLYSPHHRSNKVILCV